MLDPLSPGAGTGAVVVLLTFADVTEARLIAHVLVEERLAACVNLHPGVESVYRWGDQVEKAAEVSGVLKTTRSRLPKVEARYRELHSYEVPEFLVLGVEAGGKNYLDWLVQSVAPQSQTGPPCGPPF